MDEHIDSRLYGDSNVCPLCQAHRENDVNSCQSQVDNVTYLLKTFRELYDEQKMCDVILKVAGKEYGAHRIILCSQSKVFQIMLARPGWEEYKQTCIELHELEECKEVFRPFLQYFYTGKLMINHVNVLPILALADKYLVKGLSRSCLRYMSKHVTHAVTHNQLFYWLSYAQACGHDEVTKKCQNYIKYNFELVANTSDFSNMDPETFVYILKQDDLVVYNEMVLFNCVVRWLNLQQMNIIDAVEEKRLMEILMNHIRFPMMMLTEISSLLISTTVKQHKDYFINRMSIGIFFHSGQRDKVESIKATSEGTSLFTPRLYTSDNFSAVLSVPDYLDRPDFHKTIFEFTCSSITENDINEWTVELSPKGIWFKQCYMVGWHGNLQIPDTILRLVRLSLTRKSDTGSSASFKISLLIYGIGGGVEHVANVRSIVRRFDADNKLVNIDHVVDFDVLNGDRNKDNPYLVGEERNEFRVRIIITPCA